MLVVSYALSLLLFAASGPWLSARAPVADSSRVGLVSYSFVDRAHNDTIRAALWYPTTDSERDTSIALQSLRVAPRGRYLARSTARGLVLVSHGTGGDEYGHWDSAEALARAGFIVATIRHAGDNARDPSGLGTDRYLYGRATQISALLDRLVSDSTWGPRIAPARIGFLGYSAGGFTGLELVGGKPNVARLGSYCSRHQLDSLYCADGLRGHFELTGRYDDRRLDPRIKAAVLWAPALAFLFDRAGLATVKAPMMLVRAANDAVVKEPDNVAHLESALPRPVPEHVIQGAGHFIFLAPCGVDLARLLGEICADPPRTSRRQVHKTLNADLVEFFANSLSR